MAKGIYVATSGSIAQLRHLEVLSNNLANVRTAGFKGDRMTFEEVVAKGDPNIDPRQPPKHFATTKGRDPDISAGPIQQTDNPLDVAITGNGMLRVQTPRGVRLTRDGQMMLGRDGTLRTSSGALVLSDKNRPVVVPPDSIPEIDPTGAISADGLELGQLGISYVDPTQPLTKDPDGLFLPPAREAPPSADASVLQGHVEESNVSPIRVMLDLVAVQRTFSALRQVISTSGDMDQLATKLAR